MQNRQGILLINVSVVCAWMMILAGLSGCQTTPQQTVEVIPPTQQSVDKPTPSPTELLPSPVIPSPTQEIVTGCTEKHGVVSRETIHSQVLPGRMVFSLYLPPCYDAKELTPVLYLLHGLTYTDDQWIRLGAVQLADEKISTGELPPFLMVFPYHPDPKLPAETNFSEAVIQTLVPWIDEHYSNCDQPACRWIGGLSRGGGWAMDIFTKADGIFSKVGGHSPSLFTHDLDRNLQKIQAAWNGEGIWLDVGQDDKEARFLQALSDRLTQAEIEHQFNIYTGNHEEAYWKTHMAEYLNWYAGDKY